MGGEVIVVEAYVAPGGIKPTAKKYGIQPSQIRNWQKNAELPLYPTPHTVEERTVIKASECHVMNHKGCASSIPHDQVLYMLQFYEQLHEHGIPVSSQVLAIVLQRISPQLNNVDVAPLQRQVLRIMKYNNINHCCVTHKA
jgi:phage-related baseplate assembly protein